MLSQLGGIFDAFASSDFLNASQFSVMHFSGSSRLIDPRLTLHRSHNWHGALAATLRAGSLPTNVTRVEFKFVIEETAIFRVCHFTRFKQLRQFIHFFGPFQVEADRVESSPTLNRQHKVHLGPHTYRITVEETDAGTNNTEVFTLSRCLGLRLRET